VVEGAPVAVARNHAFVLIGRLQREKGVLDFAEASRTAGVPAIFLGEGPESDRIREINPSAVVMPWGGRDAVEAVLRQARCIVLPSRWKETFGLTVLEAQALGVPAIVARNSGAAELVERAEGGLIIESADIAGFANALRKLADDETLATALGRNAHVSYSSGFWGTAAYGERLVACYESILQAHHHAVSGDPGVAEARASLTSGAL
jgi:glycosyltransferase involved in cell wall biosynthesis